MFDTLNMWKDREAMAGDDPLAIAQYLTKPKQGWSEDDGYFVSGLAGNYKIYATQRGISIKGSLAKYFLPSNVYTLTRATAQQAIEMLSDQLHIDVSTATVTRADISTVIPTKHKPSAYYPQLGDKPYCPHRVQATDGTLYYQTQQKQLAFYDKTAEAKAKRAKIPPLLTDRNLLRYELRYSHRLQEQLKQADPVTAARLTDQAFYYMLVQQWKQEFDSIKKIHKNTLVMEKIKTVNEAERLFFARLIQQHGGKAAVDEFMADIKASNAFGDNKTQYVSNLKAKLNKVLQIPVADDEDIIIEIEKAVANYARYAR